MIAPKQCVLYTVYPADFHKLTQFTKSLLAFTNLKIKNTHEDSPHGLYILVFKRFINGLQQLISIMSLNRADCISNVFLFWSDLLYSLLRLHDN